MATNLITRSEYKAYANLTNPNTDAEIDAIIPKVSAYVKTYCNRTFNDYVDEFKVEYFNGGIGSYILAESPVISVSSLEYSTDFGQTYRELTEFTDWVEDEGYIVSVHPSGFPRQLKGYRVSYTAGYESLPEDLKLAICDLVTYYRRNDAAIHSSKAPGTNAVQIEYISTTSLPAHIRRVLDLYRADYS
jgi:hypothetical protein